MISKSYGKMSVLLKNSIFRKTQGKTQEQNILENFHSEKVGWFYELFVERSRGAAKISANI